jgi:hypothetical protein
MSEYETTIVGDSASVCDTTYESDTSEEYVLIKPYRLNPSLLDHRSIIFNASSGNNENSSQNNDKNDKKNLFKKLFSTFIPLDKFKRNNENAIIDTRYNYYKYEKTLMTMFINSKDEQEALSVLAQLWKEMKFCDLILCLNNNKEYLAHRLVLALHSRKYKYAVGSYLLTYSLLISYSVKLFSFF